MNSAVRRLVVGLGNPGDRFALTRHNVGALALDHIVEKFLPSFSSDPEGKDYKLQKSDEMNAFLCETNIGFFQGGEPGRDGRVVDYDFVDAVSSRRRARTRNEGVPFTNVDLVLMRPGTYMNQSGGPVRVFLDGNRYKLRSNPNSSNLMDELVVVFDDVSLPFGTIRFSPKEATVVTMGCAISFSVLTPNDFPACELGLAQLTTYHNCQNMSCRTFLRTKRLNSQLCFRSSLQLCACTCTEVMDQPPNLRTR